MFIFCYLVTSHLAQTHNPQFNKLKEKFKNFTWKLLMDHGVTQWEGKVEITRSFEDILFHSFIYFTLFSLIQIF